MLDPAKIKKIMLGIDSLTQRFDAVVKKKNVRLDSEDFKESDHPRASDGKFGSGGGGSSEKVGPISRASLSSSDHKAFKEYQYGDYANLNGDLRAGKVDKEKESLIKDLDEAISKGKLEKDTKVFRGMAGNSAFKFKIGEVLTDKGYMSTSTDESISEDFSVGVGLDFSATIKLKVPKGNNAAFFKDYDGYEHNEVLLPRNTKYKVTKVSKGSEDGHVVVEAEVVSEGGSSQETKSEPAIKQQTTTKPSSPSPDISVESIISKYSTNYRSKQWTNADIRAVERDVKKLAKASGRNESELFRELDAKTRK